MQDLEEEAAVDRTGIGCAVTALVLNTLLIGLVTASFTRGPYSSDEQELWYRYGSLAFFVVGAVLPGIALFTWRQSPRVLGACVAGMAATFVAFVWYVMMSGGGV